MLNQYSKRLDSHTSPDSVQSAPRSQTQAACRRQPGSPRSSQLGAFQESNECAAYHIGQHTPHTGLARRAGPSRGGEGQQKSKQRWVAHAARARQQTQRPPWSRLVGKSSVPSRLGNKQCLATQTCWLWWRHAWRRRSSVSPLVSSACRAAAAAARLKLTLDQRINPCLPLWYVQRFWDCSQWSSDRRRHAAASAAFHGQIDSLEWLRSVGLQWRTEICTAAARGGRLSVLQWLRQQDLPCPWDTWTCTVAAENGHLPVLQWARQQDPPCPWDWYTCSEAAMNGHLRVLQWARQQDPPCPWNSVICTCAAENGHLHVLQWARQQDPPCPWNSFTCTGAARNGHLSVLQWARQQDPPCPWSAWEKAYSRERAALFGHHDVVGFIDSSPA
jgi:hypothetical protein